MYSGLSFHQDCPLDWTVHFTLASSCPPLSYCLMDCPVSIECSCLSPSRFPWIIGLSHGLSSMSLGCSCPTDPSLPLIHWIIPSVSALACSSPTYPSRNFPLIVRWTVLFYLSNPGCSYVSHPTNPFLPIIPIMLNIIQ